MKRNIILLLLLIFFIPFGCSKGEKAKIKVEKSVEEKIKLPDRLKVIEDLKKIREAIVVYRNLNDTNPSSLKDLNLKLYYPGEYTYNSKTGEVKSKHH